MLTTVVAFALLASPIKLAAPGFSSANYSEESVRALSDHFARQLALREVEVVTASDIAALLGAERQRQLMGCADAANSCLVELANALGTTAVVAGSVGHFGTGFTVNIKVLSSEAGKQLAVFSSEATAEGDLPGLLSLAADQIADQLRVVAGLPTFKSQRRARLVTAGVIVGAVFAVAGAVLLGTAFHERAALTSPESTLQTTDAFAIANRGPFEMGAGWAVAGIGVAVLAVTLIGWLVTQPSADGRLAERATQSGGALAGWWP